jgi:hypothetical protein
VGRRFLERALQAGVRVTAVDASLERLEPWRDRVPTVFGDPARGLGAARAVVLAAGDLPAKMRICAIVRQAHRRIAILAVAANEAERAWLREFGVEYLSSVNDEMSEALLRALRRAL